eukprot:8341814-Pyramimonas_sp.AAC.2
MAAALRIPLYLFLLLRSSSASSADIRTRRVPSRHAPDRLHPPLRHVGVHLSARVAAAGGAVRPVQEPPQ